MLLSSYRLCIITIVFFTTLEAFGRWSHHDADALDRVTGLGTEYYNDILSYRDPRLWDELWQGKTSGFRTSAASMNKKELYYFRQIKLRSSDSAAWQLAYASERQEEPRRIEENSCLELSYGPLEQSWRFGLLGDGATEKSYGDIGMNISWAPSENSSYQLVYWSVDPFYTEKKLEIQDFRTRNPSTVELKARQNWGELALSLRHVQDQPVSWHRSTRDQYYTFRRQKTEWMIEYLAQENQKFYTTLQQERRQESLFTLNQDLGEGYLHKEHTVEFGLKQRDGRDSILWAVWGLTSRTLVHGIEQIDDQHQSLDRRMNRDEAALLWNRSFPIGQSGHRQELGLTINKVSLQELKKGRSTEVKLNWGPDWQLSKEGRFKINSTWDIDQLVSDFPFRKKGFHPWGGGQASFLIHF